MFVFAVLNSEMDPVEIERLRDLTATTHKLGKRALNTLLSEARRRAATARQNAIRERRIADAGSGRVVLDRPIDDAEWLPLMDRVGHVLGEEPEPVPPMRDIEHGVVLVELRRLDSLHLLTSEEGNDNDDA
jgi:hypothetical protein